MVSAIDVTKPVYGIPTTQSVRTNFQAAYDEITDLQSKTVGAPFLPTGGGSMSGVLTLANDPVLPYEAVTKRYVDNLSFGGGGSGGIPDALADGMAYARMYVPGGMSWVKDPLFRSVHIGSDGLNDYFRAITDGTYNFPYFDASNNFIRLNRSTNVFEMVINNVVRQSWSATTTSISNINISNNSTITGASPALHLTSPTVGDEYVYFETGTNKRWAIGADAANTGLGVLRYDAAGAYVDRPFVIDYATGRTTFSGFINLSRPAGQVAQIAGLTGTSVRWAIQPGDGTAETGSNSGSNFSISRFSDAGAYIDAPITINRANGIVSVTNLSVASFGISYPARGGNRFSFGWDGTFITGFVDNVSLGALATTGWVNGNFATTSWVSNNFATYGWVSGNFKNIGAYTPNQNVDHSTSPTFDSPYVNNWVNCNVVMNRSGIFYVANNTNYYLNRDQSNGFWNFVENGVGNCTIRTDGYVIARSAFQSGFMYITDFGRVGGPGINYAPWGSNNIAFQWTGSGVNAFVDWSYGGNIPSDERLKTVIGSYDRGLDELMQINPILFRLKGNDRGIVPDTIEDAATKQQELLAGPSIRDTNKVHVGFVAQQVEPIFPELIQYHEGLIDGEVSDIRYVDEGPWLTFALLNAVKQLNTRLSVLEAKP